MQKLPLDSSLQTNWEHLRTKESTQTPFHSYAWHALWQEVFETSHETFVLLTPDKIIAPFTHAQTTISFAGGDEIADYLDIIGEDSKKQEAWKEICMLLKSDGFTNLHLRNIPNTSSSLQYFQSIPDAQVAQEDTTPSIALPETWESYLAQLNRKDRHELKRKIRKFETEHPDILFAQSIDKHIDTQQLVRLMKLNEDKKIFLTPQMEKFFLALPKTFPDTLHLFLLRSSQETIAAILCFIQDDTLYLYNSGFDDAHFTGSGFYIVAKSIQWAIEHHIKTYNFLQGNERYKYDLGAVDFPVWKIDLQL